MVRYYLGGFYVIYKQDQRALYRIPSKARISSTEPLYSVKEHLIQRDYYIMSMIGFKKFACIM